MNESPKITINHVAIIMDGNGRWAQTRTHPRVWGHIRGSSVVSNIVEEATDLGIKALTLYAFSTENWSRPASEIKVLFGLLKKFLNRERKRILDNDICFKVIGEIEELPKETINLIHDLESLTKDNKGLKLTFGFGYGGRKEIVHSVNKFILNNKDKLITEEDIGKNLYSPENGDVDLLIRTGGDQRISNFLLWQMAYSELFFTNTKWPEFGRKEFREIYQYVSQRERRFGNIFSSKDLEQTQKMAKINKKLIQEVIRN